MDKQDVIGNILARGLRAMQVGGLTEVKICNAAAEDKFPVHPQLYSIARVDLNQLHGVPVALQQTYSTSSIHIVKASFGKKIAL